MKKALKKILALVATGAMAISAFAMSASAAPYHHVSSSGYCYDCGKYHEVYPAEKYSMWCSVCGEYHYGYTHDYAQGYYDRNGNWHWYDVEYGYYYGDYDISWSAQNWKDGKITVNVSGIPSDATVTYRWTSTTNVIGTATKDATISFNGNDKTDYSATCNVTVSYRNGYSQTIPVTVSGKAYSSASNARGNADEYLYSGYYYDGIYYPSYVVPSRYDYEVDWDTDTFYYNGRKQVPTATVTIGKRTIELDVRIIAGDKDSTDVGSYRASASLPSGYRGYKLSGSTIRYTIEEPLKQGLVNENGGVYYYTNGKAATGWKTIGNDTYYFGKDGKATVGWIKLEGKWYYFDTAGIMQTGWVRSGGKTYYTNASGVMVASKWMKLDGYWYYFGETGAMAESEWVKTGGKWYYLSADGKMATNTTIPGGYRVDANGVWVK